MQIELKYNCKLHYLSLNKNLKHTQPTIKLKEMLKILNFLSIKINKKKRHKMPFLQLHTS